MIVNRLIALAILTALSLMNGWAWGSEEAHQVPPSVDWSSLELPRDQRPVEVEFSFHLLDVLGVDDEAETFEFSGVLTLKWKDERRRFDPMTAGVREKLNNGAFQFNKLSPSWFPQVVLANASKWEVSNVLQRTSPDGSVTTIQKIHAVARSPLELRRYPFDHQQLMAVFEILGFGDEEVEFKAATNNVTVDLNKVRVPEWELTAVNATPASVSAPYSGTDGRASSVLLTFDVSRHAFYMLRLVLLPLLIVVTLSWTVFWMDHSSLGDRMAVSFVGILTAVAYQSMISGIMPQIAYITFLNACVSLSFLLMSLTAVVNLVVDSLDRRGLAATADRLDHRCRWLFPLVFVLLILGNALVTLL